VFAPAGASTVPAYNPRLHNDLGGVIIPGEMPKSLRANPPANFFCKIALIVIIVTNVGCHGFRFTSPMFDFTVDGEQNTKDESRGSEVD